jgi:hypothetical protein
MRSQHTHTHIHGNTHIFARNVTASVRVAAIKQFGDRLLNSLAISTVYISNFDQHTHTNTHTRARAHTHAQRGVTHLCSSVTASANASCDVPAPLAASCRASVCLRRRVRVSALPTQSCVPFAGSQVRTQLLEEQIQLGRRETMIAVDVVLIKQTIKHLSLLQARAGARALRALHTGALAHTSTSCSRCSTQRSNSS